jgi:ribose transport system ATP-binding protein
MSKIADAARRPALDVIGLGKTFAGARALEGLSMRVEAGEIRALVGENGSGKSTLVKILSGFHAPDPGGRVLVDGRDLLGGTADPAQLGLRFVHQDLGLLGSLSVADNLFLGGTFPRRFGAVDQRRQRQQATAALRAAGLDVDPGRKVAELSAAVRTGVAIARASQDYGARPPAKVLVLDEPTATLPEKETGELIAAMRAAAAAGVAVIFVSHRLEEVLAVADTVTVLRDGTEAATRPADELSRAGLVTLMCGQLPAEVSTRSSGQAERPAVVLRANGLLAPGLHGVCLEVGRGEVVGVAGITGSGRETLLAALFGAISAHGGSVEVKGRVLPAGQPRAAIAAGLAYLPADRRSHGILPSLTTRENLTVSDLRPVWRWPSIRRRLERAEVAAWFRRFSVRPADASERPMATLSGGNQQKVLLSRWLRRRPEVILLDEPTQGVDVGAKADIHRAILQAADDGAAVLIASSDADELLALSHRVLVVRRGVVVAERGAATLDAPEVARLAHTGEAA